LKVSKKLNNRLSAAGRAGSSIRDKAGERQKERLDNIPRTRTIALVKRHGAVFYKDYHDSLQKMLMIPSDRFLQGL